MCRAEGCSKARDAHLQGSAPCGADMRKPATTRGCMEKSVESAVANCEAFQRRMGGASRRNPVHDNGKSEKLLAGEGEHL